VFLFLSVKRCVRLKYNNLKRNIFHIIREETFIIKNKNEEGEGIMSEKGFSNLKKDVIDAGLCTACGTCVGACAPKAISIDFETDEPEPKLIGDCVYCGICYSVCPGKDIPLRELDKVFLGKDRDFEKDKLGIYKYCGRGNAKDEDIKIGATSGGMISSLLICALEEGIIDAALLAGWRKDKPWRCKPYIATNREEVLQGLRTGMMIVPINELLYEAAMIKKYNKIAIVGLPCHIHGIRKLQQHGKPKKIADSIKLTLGLFCSATYYWEGTKHLLQEFGKIKSIDSIKAMDYRGGKKPEGLYVLTKDGKIHFVASKHDYTWHMLGAASYKRDRCLMCVDFTAELADISCGDIFQNVDDKEKHWVATLIRTEIGEKLIKLAIDKKYINFTEHNPDLILASGMGWEAKKHAGVYRLLQRKKYGWPTPDYDYDISETPLPRDLKFPK